MKILLIILLQYILLLKDKGNYQFETQYKRKDGSLSDVEISMRLLKLQDEEVVQLFVRDIIERKTGSGKDRYACSGN